MESRTIETKPVVPVVMTDNQIRHTAERYIADTARKNHDTLRYEVDDHIAALRTAPRAHVLDSLWTRLVYARNHDLTHAPPLLYYHGEPLAQYLERCYQAWDYQPHRAGLSRGRGEQSQRYSRSISADIVPETQE